MQKVCKNLIIMQNYLLDESLYINDFHRKNSMAAQREVQQMLLRPCSREQKVRQIQMLKEMSEVSKDKSNLERSKKQSSNNGQDLELDNQQ